MVIFIVATTSIAISLMGYALRENINLFYTPSSVISGDAPLNTTIRIGGMVVKDSLIRSKKSLQSTFRVTDGKSEVDIHYDGILPDMFSEGEGAVATGEINSDLIFIASSILAKHDENYMPPEVIYALDEAAK
jgi:cytochrome c-type biogenesis protein CcmE|tara:strand:- start:8037 stop:8435 length:399 start_codon:yes stop_codon:yes gene_type:complete